MSSLRPGRVVAWIILITALVLTIFPFYWMVRTALTPAADHTAARPASGPTTPP